MLYRLDLIRRIFGPRVRISIHGRRLRLGEAFQVTLQQNRRRNPIDRSFPLFTTHVRGDQQVFRRFGRHSLVPGHDRHGQRGFQPLLEDADRVNRRSLAAVETQRQPEEHPRDVVSIHQVGDVRDVALKGAALERFQRLGGPPQLVAQRDSDPFCAVIQRQDPSAAH